ncbi:hypothetical protein [Actinocorallia longicatena]|uniref:Uncharacterized protein n=1 Tax=Actinocorallia longicatena TaxID=111803 RepID=A0ABP6Q9N1_9ACTN
MIRFVVQLLLESAVGGQAAGPIEYVLMALIALALVAVAVALVWRGQGSPRRIRSNKDGGRGEGLLTCCVAVVALLIALHGMWAAIVAFVALAAFTLKLRTSRQPSRPEPADQDDEQRAEGMRR